ncbi:S1 family peptidase [Streptomyces sp. NPDC020801]|uniref:S1 family peptidase n=1 Tax=unclassified Streptomyces TaxID=2593676 RepID=UPI0037914935
MAKFRRIAALAAVPVAVGVIAFVADPAMGVVGGSETENPGWVVALDGDSFCTGSLVSSSWVVTAKHCMNSVSQARIGSDSHGDGGTTRDIVQQVAGQGDVALMKLSEPVDNTPIEIADSTPDPGQSGTAYGWGATCGTSDCPLSTQLKKLSTTVASSASCGGEDPFLCIDVTENNTTCYGDSGGPFVVGGRLVGADSSGGEDVCGIGGEAFGDVAAQKSSILDIIKG